ncbi:MAG: hypothetical protein MUP70_12450 [Candidatus Aminicenantes bacterium]|nr:hypothetical protein [Candidatus Aminicenantes bacterium]
MNINDFLAPYIITNVLSLLMILICWKKPKSGNIIWGFVFLAAGLLNLFHGITKPASYLDYANMAVFPFLRDIINGPFSRMTTPIIALIAVGQMMVGFFLLYRSGRLNRLGIAGGTLFLICIAPLGVGSAFPASLLMAASLILIYIHLPPPRE